MTRNLPFKPRTPTKMNATEIPKSYLPGLQILETFTATQMRLWLHDETHEREHLLAGGHDDQPVQAILNHAEFLSGKAKGLLIQTVRDEIVIAWSTKPEFGDPSAIEHLLNLAEGLPVLTVKNPLQDMLRDGRFGRVPEHLRGYVLSTIATLSNESDTSFWLQLVPRYPNFAGMAFQVLLRTSVDEAMNLLYTLIPDDKVAGSVVRALSHHLSPKAVTVDITKPL